MNLFYSREELKCKVLFRIFQRNQLNHKCIVVIGVSKNTQMNLKANRDLAKYQKTEITKKKSIQVFVPQT